MALTWPAKASTAVVRYVWTPPLVDGDSIASHTLTVSSGTAVVDSSEIEDGAIVAFISGGTAGAVTVFSASAVTAEGETLPETIYLPIYGPAVTIGDTAGDYVSFALRKVFGAASTPARASEDGLERLNAMLLAWRVQGADVGAVFPLASATTMSVPDEYVEGIRANLILAVADRYGVEPPAKVIDQAARGLQLIKSSNLSDERDGGTYF